MRIGMISKWEEPDIKFAADTKIPFVEFIPWLSLAEFTAQRKQTETLLDRYHVKVAAMGFFNRDILNPDAAARASALKDIHEMIDLCKDWSSPVFMMGAGTIAKHRDERDALKESIETLKKIVDYAGQRNVTVAIYNCTCDNFCTTPRHWEALLSAIPQIRFKYDPSHPYFAGRDYLSELRDFGQYLVHFHAKGCIKATDGHIYDPPAGLDNIDWRSVMGLLYRAEYQGVISLETHSPIWSDPNKFRYQGLRFSANYLRSLQVE